MVYTEDGFEAGDLFLSDVKSGKNKLAGAVTWEPKVSEVVSGSGGQAHVLITNRNLLIIADVLIVHRGFAQEQPKIVQGLVQGLLEGNRLMRDKPDQQIDVVARAFKWDRDKTKSELANVHLSNLPENLAFFSGAMDAAGSFGGIYQSAVLAYGSDVIKDPPDPSRFAELSALQTIEKSGIFKDQTVAIAPIRTTQRHVGRKRPAAQQGHPVHVRAERGQARLANQDNVRNLEAIKRLLQVSPGSTLLLRGHVDNAKVAEFRKTGGEAYVRTQALRAMELSKNRAGEIRQLLIDRYSHRPQAHRHRRPRLGRAVGTQFGSESAGRGAVVHGGVKLDKSQAPSPKSQGTRQRPTPKMRRFGRPLSGSCA